MSEQLDHLTDGREVVAPFVLAGHHPRESTEASPVLAEVLVSDDDLGAHPYSGTGATLGRFANGQLVIVATDRLAHTAACERCAPVWNRLRSAFEGIPSDASITGGIEVDTSEGVATLLVDVGDLPDEAFEDDERTK